MIREGLADDKVRIAQIGLAGENLVRFANIVNELKHFNGRNGLGAVMGSKKLKAIAVRGTKPIDLFGASGCLFVSLVIGCSVYRLASAFPKTELGYNTALQLIKSEVIDEGFLPSF